MAEDTHPPVSATNDGGAEREPRYRPLVRWERAGAIAAGIAFGAAGFTFMFLTKNEGGVAIAILLAAHRTYVRWARRAHRLSCDSGHLSDNLAVSGASEALPWTHAVAGSSGKRW